LIHLFITDALSHSTSEREQFDCQRCEPRATHASYRVDPQDDWQLKT
jgi:hypothetical protein